MSNVDSVIRSMCLAELAVWHSRNLDYRAVLDEYHRYNASRHHIFLFNIEHGRVSIAEKPNFYTSAQLDADLEQEWDSIPSVVRAAIMYRSLLAEACQSICPDIDTVIAVDVGDLGISSETAPLFGITKLPNSNAVLLPHFEFIWDRYYQHLQDATPYEEKTVSAMFMGSTTGKYPITADDVRELSVPRLRSAVFFKDDPRVTFKLLHLLQCTPEAEALLRQMEFGGEARPFEEHFARKFIISMDGNAATCSRVSMASKSNCVLLKYDSPYLLHYSRHFVPWLHYVPILEDQDVNVVLDIEERFPGIFQPLAIESTRFFDNYLSKAPLVSYTGNLVRMYAEIFGHPRLGSPEAAALGIAAAPATMLSRADVVEAYRVVLGRDPESEEVIQDHLACFWIPELYRVLISSDEFRHRYADELEAAASD